MSNKPQTFANHTRFDPWFHFFIVPVLLIFLIFRVVALIRQYPHHRHENAAFALLFVVLLAIAFRARVYALKVQDRVIRLEERLRLAALLPDSLQARIPEVTERQLIGLRFASDAEVPGLVERTLNENLTPKDIKKAIQNWRPDHFRV